MTNSGIWNDALGSNAMTVNTLGWSNMQSYWFNYTLQGLNFTHTLTTATAQAIVIVANFGYVPTITNKTLISDSLNGGWYASLRTTGQIRPAGLGSNAKTYLDGAWVQDTNSVGNITVPAGAYYNKWSVWILNNLTLNNQRLNILGYQSDPNGGTYLGTKVACIAIYTQPLSNPEIASVTTWAQARFATSG